MTYSSRALSIGASDSPAGSRPEALGLAAEVGAERRSAAPSFTVGGVVFECFRSVDDQRFIWRSADRRLEVSVGDIRFPTDDEYQDGMRAFRLWRAIVDGVEIKADCVSIRAAMDAAVWAMRRGE